MSTNQPNILLLQPDQHRYDCIGANGHPLVRTPNIDRLADDGMRFSHAFCPVPLCCPARASMMTGQWPSKHFMINNVGTEAPRGFPDGTPTFSEPLKQAGYWLGYVGKWHAHHNREPTEFGFDEFIDQWKSGYHDWRKEQGLPPVMRWQTHGWFGKTDPDTPPEKSFLAWMADHIIRMIEEAVRANKPFFIRWDPTEPHLPNFVPEPYASMYPPADIEPWPSFADELEDKPYIQSQQLRTWKIEDWTWEQWAPIVSLYLGEITLLDAQIGRILDKLEELGVAENTFVAYTTDHGDMCGAHRQIDKQFIMYEDVVHVPLFVRWPGQIKPGTCSDAFVSNAIDLSRTFLEVAQLPVPNTFQGESLMPILQEQTPGTRPDIFAMYYGSQMGLYSQRMVRNRRWKYVWNLTDRDELYDLETDPAELTNRADDPACAQTLARLRRRTVEWMEQIEDPLLNTWTEAQLLEGRKT